MSQPLRAMDFFGSQQRARRNTARLVVLFTLAVIGIVAAVYVAVVLILGLAGGTEDLLQPQLMLSVGGGVIATVGIAVLYKTAQLRGRGDAVARLLGGQEVLPETRDLQERTLYNVVEEMAIAAGMPTPAVFVLEHEQGINAFAAGWRPGDAAIAVTRGCLEQLDRDQLQGVVAHEFSHLFHGDSQTNVRLLGFLFGISCIATGGYIVLRAATSGGSRKGHAAMAALGVALLVIGAVGGLFARLIRAAVSRQREFLADAAAVQYTRNPRGIAGALAKIAAAARGGRLASAQAAEVSHMLFVNGLRSSFLGWLATHPPIERRIAAIEPMLARYPADALRDGAARNAAVPPAPPRARATALQPAQLLAAIGTIDGAPAVEHARGVLAALPLQLASALREPFGARAALLALLLDGASDTRRRQLDALREHIDGETFHEVVTLASSTASLAPEHRLPCVDLAIPSLRRMTAAQYQQFRRAMDAVVSADEKVSAFEFTLSKVIKRHVDPAFARRRSAPIEHHTVLPVLPECDVVLSTLARAGKGDREDGAALAYAAGAASLPRARPAEPSLLPRDRCAVADLDRALDKLARLSPPAKRTVMLACAGVVAHDGTAQAEELELLRAIADSLDAPLPPLLTAVAAGV
jgi:Zn-dependent protease with chaperone function